MKEMVITADTLFDGSKRLPHPAVVVEDGRIASVYSREEAELPRDAEIGTFPARPFRPRFSTCTFMALPGTM